MDNLIKKLFKQSRQVRLEKQKKDSIGKSVLLFMKNNPLAVQKRAGFWQTLFVQHKSALISAGSLALVVLICGAVSVQANSALPGDIFYPVKTSVNEKVMQVLSFSDEAKTKLSVKLAGKRLQEAEKLAVEGKITKNNQAKINANFSVQADMVAKSINRLKKEKKYLNAEKIASGFEVSLKAHSQALRKSQEIKSKKSKNNVSIDPLINNIDNEIKKARNKD